MTSVDLANLRAQLKRQEGVRLKPYKCPAGKLTIGCGRNLDDRGITLEEAETLLDHDINGVLAECSRTFGFWLTLDTVRQAVLLNMAFNIGLPALLAFRKMLAAIERQDYAAAADEMETSQWAAQVPRRAVVLAAQMRSGTWA